MIVAIKEDVFKSSDFKSLNYVIQMLTYKQRYLLFIEITVVKNTDFYKKLDFDDQKQIEENYNYIVTAGLNPNYFISLNSSSHNVFGIHEAIRFFLQPVSIILENSLNDQYFLKAIIKFFDRSGEIQKHLNNGWIQFENSGGCSNVENFINGKMQSFNNLYHPSHYYLRCIVILDSDKEYETAPLKSLYINLEQFFTSHNVVHHILYKRSMENYLPSEVYQYIALPELTNWVSSYDHLSNDQKDFLSINNGFSPKNSTGNSIKLRNELATEIQLLYSNLQTVNYENLDKGFKIPNFKTEFPKHFEHHQVHKNTLQARCGNNEFQEIVDKILKLL